MSRILYSRAEVITDLEEALNKAMNSELLDLYNKWFDGALSHVGDGMFELEVYDEGDKDE